MYHDNSAPEGCETQSEWIECRQCRSVMQPLRSYELPSSSEFPAVEAEIWELLLWGWIIIVINFLTGLITYGGRKRKLATLKRDLLSRYPNSLVCPRCLAVDRKV